MAPFIIAAIVGASLFTGGTVIKPKAPEVGKTMQWAGIGTVLGGGLGAFTGTAGGTASVLGTSAASTVGTAAVVGGATGAAGAIATDEFKFLKF